MRTFSLLKGLPVYELKSGEKIGDIYDLNISSSGIVKGILIKNGDFFRKSYMIRIENITDFGLDGVMVQDKKVLEPINSPDYTLEHKQSLTGKMIMSNKGDKLGLLEDVYFLEEMGTIVGYELTDGFFSDITEGKRVVKTADPPAIGKDAIIVNVKTT
ncbi:PRC-barrel domain protein [Bacillus methanolicus PB1]|uniref:PRC-barrel domain protein n=1 Tax=Bacillus methanolicus PB1 TaxID=997296 RepID=I3DXL2_BACMT|nr:PRC-barrel domain-containing protein [Bacillus methanolicus]EIJ78983.1 PRC-barrel domain protein [Bacillus methanolicus PB1]